MEWLVPIIVQLIGGAAGGNIVGVLLKNINLSKLIATISGIVGGIAGGQVATATGVLESVLGQGGMSDMLGNGGAAAGGGAILTLIVGLIKKAMAGNAA